MKEDNVVQLRASGPFSEDPLTEVLRLGSRAVLGSPSRRFTAGAMPSLRSTRASLDPFGVIRRLDRRISVQPQCYSLEKRLGGRLIRRSSRRMTGGGGQHPPPSEAVITSVQRH